MIARKTGDSCRKNTQAYVNREESHLTCLATLSIILAKFLKWLTFTCC